MTFEHMFSIPTDHPHIELSKKKHSDKCEYEIGQLIGKTFGWNLIDHPRLLVSNINRYKLEIEAFPMDKWIYFKNKLFTELSRQPVRRTFILQMIKELEIHGKSSGDAITNQQLNK